MGFDDLDPALREVLRARVERLGYLGEFFQCAAHQPAALVSLDALTGSFAAPCLTMPPRSWR